jgi:hypothetical protein
VKGTRHAIERRAFMLSEEAISKYQQIYKKVHGKDLPYEKAKRDGLALLQLVKIIYRPIPKTVENQSTVKTIK